MYTLFTSDSNQDKIITTIPKFNSVKKIIEEEITKLIVSYCQFYDQSGLFQSFFRISHQHLLNNNTKLIEYNKDTNVLSLIFKDPPNSLF